MNSSDRVEAPPVPWWKVGSMWLVLGGPAVVVVASFVTLYLAVTRPDPVYGEAAQPRAADMRTGERLPQALAPAMQARNHAATGVVPPTAREPASAPATPQGARP